MPTDRPNILVIWGDDIGISNLSCYSDGLMGYRTPNIDRIAEEGARFTDYYGEQSCTAGRAAFICGQNPIRTGLTKVGMPGANVGLQAEDPTIATALKAHGYATGQFGKNHLGDRDEHLPTVHGFDEFFGNLYHLNAEEEPELADYPTPEDLPNFRERFGPRGVIHSWANDDGTQRIEDTGPLTKKRMETVDDEFLAAASVFIRDKAAAEQPFFVWFNATHMHFRTHVKPESRGQAGRWQSEYHDTMIDHDKLVGDLLALLDELGIAEDTIVVYSTDNGPHMNTWPDGGMTPFRGEKNSNWEGAYRVPAVVRWPGRIAAGTVLNGIVSHNDWFPTLLAAAGVPDIADAAEGRRRPRRHAVPRAPRRLRPARLPHRSDAGEPAPVLLLRLRRRRSHRGAVRQLEAGLPRATCDGHAPGLGRAVHPAAGAQDLQPAHRPVRTGRHHLEHLLRLDPRPCLGGGADAGVRLPDDPELRRVPAPAEAGDLQPRGRARRAADGSPQHVTESATSIPPGAPPADDMVWVPGGTFRMGSDDHYREEAPARDVQVDGSWVARTTVTNAAYAAFVDATGYRTVAERPLDPADFPGAPVENLVPGSMVFVRTPGPVDLRHLSQWWVWTPGACWWRPEGPGSDLDGREDHPVVHVAYEDAEAYATWAGLVQLLPALPARSEAAPDGRHRDEPHRVSTPVTLHADQHRGSPQRDDPGARPEVHGAAVRLTGKRPRRPGPCRSPEKKCSGCFVEQESRRAPKRWFPSFPRSSISTVTPNCSPATGSPMTSSSPVWVAVPEVRLRALRFLCDLAAVHLMPAQTPTARPADGGPEDWRLPGDQVPGPALVAAFGPPDVLVH